MVTFNKYEKVGFHEELSETDKCREQLKKIFKPEYHNYIDTKLAGDFACQIAKEYKKKQVGVQPYSYGWTCPVCGSGNAPFANTCPCQGWAENKVTC